MLRMPQDVDSERGARAATGVITSTLSKRPKLGFQNGFQPWDETSRRASHDDDLAVRHEEVEHSAQPRVAGVGQPDDCGEGAQSALLVKRLIANLTLSGPVLKTRPPIAEGFHLDGHKVSKVSDHKIDV